MKYLLILLIFLFSGCSQKENIVIKKEFVCMKQYKVERPQANIQIRNEQGNIELAKAYKEAVNMVMDFYEKQVQRNNELCVPKVGNDDKSNIDKAEKK